MSPTETPMKDEPSASCPRCGTKLSTENANLPCPVCLLQLGLESWQADEPASTPTEAVRDRFYAPEIAELQAYFPGFKFLSLLGKGGMGAVYLATQIALDRQVALKIIRPESAADTDFAERFSREARSLARLDHPNIVGVHDFGHVLILIGNEDDPQKLYYIVMEYVDGLNLRDLPLGRFAPPS